LTLRGLLWRPTGAGPFPGVLFNHGSGSTTDPVSTEEPSTLGPLFARHGYVFLFLFRQGIGLSQGQGTADGDLMARASAAEGVQGRNRVQMQLLEGEELDEVNAGLVFLRNLPKVDPKRVAIVGHSFGGSLTLVLAAHETTVRAAVVFGPAAASWAQSPQLRARLLSAVDHVAAPVMFIHTANDYSVAPGEALAAEMQRHNKPRALKIYPAFGATAREGHSIVYLNVPTWERDVFRFLDERLQVRPNE
jgi:dienelactone hydrolase